MIARAGIKPELVVCVPIVLYLACRRLEPVVCAYNPCLWEAGAGGLQARDQLVIKSKKDVPRTGQLYLVTRGRTPCEPGFLTRRALGVSMGMTSAWHQAESRAPDKATSP